MVLLQLKENPMCYHPLCISLKPKTDLFELSKEIYENHDLYEGESQLELLNKISMISVLIFGMTMGVATFQHYYFPINQTFETGVRLFSLMPLQIAIVALGAREFETLRLDVLNA